MDLKKGLLMFSSSQTDRLQMKEMKNIASPDWSVQCSLTEHGV